MIGARNPLPVRFASRVRHHHALLRFTKSPQQGIGAGVKSDRPRGFDVLKSFVAAQRADDKLRMTIAQHYVRAVVRDELAQVVEQGFEHTLEAEVFGEGDIRVTQELRLLPYRLFSGQAAGQVSGHE